ncbi:MAG TPA: heme-binding protein [Sphingomonas sp.]|jgi:uncharacterized protein GlcG (DUF336 family)|uniref:GlcG/HbpS family heme-binding protein n=1 Tax=Sphingomonas sp. TaxID=28214 RepID=UPI002EDB728D
MTMLTLTQGNMVASAAMAAGAEQGFAPLCCVVLDAGGAILVVQRSEQAAPYRVEIARAKAAGCIGMGLGGRSIATRAAKVPAFYAAVNALVPLVPVPGGVLVRSATGELMGAVGISGDTADNDELCALAGIAAAGLVAEA